MVFFLHAVTFDFVVIFGGCNVEFGDYHFLFDTLTQN
jgi:hypothetical protein